MHYSEPTNLVIVDRFTKFTPDLINYSIFSFEPFCKKLLNLPKKAREELDVLLWLIILNFEF